MSNIGRNLSNIGQIQISQHPGHLGGWFLYQNGVEFNFQYQNYFWTCHMSNIGPNISNIGQIQLSQHPGHLGGWFYTKMR